ncbi:MAG: AI-2E family transporter [Ectothiorhodospiraceae bacterium]|nr:AI-2E family transporter [Ectothiorhodospiraceae bacterium]MCH8506418.1 AI-2E family transporter [Ectothiorhodospiraceae bacterium]
MSIHGLFALGVLYTLYLAREVILPITLAVLTSLLLAPIVRKLARQGLHPGISALGLLLALVLVVGGLLAVTMRPAVEWLEMAPEGVSRLLVQDSELRELYDSMTRSAREVEEQLAEATEEEEAQTVVVHSESWRGQLTVALRDSLAAVALALALSFFLLVNGDQLIHHFVRQLPGRQRRLTALRVIRDAQGQIARYLAFITVSNTLVGVVTGIMVWALGLPSAVVWGVLAGLLRFIPYLGVILTVVVLAVVSAVSHEELLMVLAAPLGYLALSALVGFFLEPYLHGFRMAINPIVIFLAIFFWGWLWGPIGVLLAVPLMTVIQVFLHRIGPLQPIYKIIAR